MLSYLRISLCIGCVVCFDNAAIADTLTLTCDTTSFKINPTTHRRLEDIRITLSKNFDQFSAEIAQTYSDGERIIVPPYEYQLVVRPRTWDLTTSQPHEPDGRHYVISLMNEGGGNYDLGESISKSNCLGAGCTITSFDVPCSTVN